MKAAAILVLATLLLAGCATTGPAPSTTPTGPDNLTPTTPTHGTLPDAPTDPALVGANNAFALDILRALWARSSDANLALSPFSVFVALGMAHEGADGSTRADMEEALRLRGIDDPAAAFRALLGNESSRDANVTLEVADSLWIDEQFKANVRPAFVDGVARSFLADVYARDLQDPSTVDVMNAWAANKTRGKVPRILDAIKAEEVAFLLNAVYFEAAWAAPFQPSCTHDAPFTRADGSPTSVRMMCGASHWAVQGHAEGGVAAARLPYGSGSFAAYVLMPADVDAFVAGLTPAGLDDAFEQAKGSPAEVELPRLKVKSHYDLKDALGDLGMGVAFTDQADLSRIAPNLKISRATHDATLDVDENGTIAAAVTTIGFEPTAAPQTERLVFDHPFLLVLRDDQTGSILFTAIVRDPTSAG